MGSDSHEAVLSGALPPPASGDGCQVRVQGPLSSFTGTVEQVELMEAKPAGRNPFPCKSWYS
jgi:hypothetical protein